MSAPNPYIRNRNRRFFLTYVPGETYTFYINSVKPLSDPDFDEFTIDLVDCDENLIEADFAELDRDIINTLQYRIFCAFEFPDCPNGFYKFIIRHGETIKAKSNLFQVVNEGFENHTCLIKYRSYGNKERFGYSNLPNFLNIYRLPVLEINRQYESEKKQYRNITDDQFRNYKSYRDTLVTIESYFFDKPAHEAMSFVYENDYIEINGSIYQPKGGYEIANRQDFTVNKASCECYEIYQEINPALINTTAPTEYVYVYAGSIDGEIIAIGRAGDRIIIRSPYYFEAQNLGS